MRRFVLLLYAIIVLAMALEAVVPPLLPTFKHDLGLSTIETSALLAMSTAAMFALAIPIGAAADRFGARIVTLLGGALLATGAAVQGLAGSFWTLLAGRAVFGVALGIIWTAGIAWLAAQPSGGARALGGTAAAAALGAVIGPIVGGPLAERYGTGAPFTVYAAAAAAVTLLLATLSDTQAGTVAERQPILQTLGQVPGQPRVAAALILVLLSGLASGSTNLLVPLALDRHGLTATQIGAVFSTMAAIFLAVSILVARRGDALVHVRVAGLGLVASAAVFLVPVTSDATPALVAYVLLRVPLAWALLATITYPLAVAGARAAGLRTGAILGLVALGWSLSSALGPLVGGAVAQLVGARGTFALLCAAYATVGAALLAADRRVEPRRG